MTTHYFAESLAAGKKDELLLDQEMAAYVRTIEPASNAEDRAGIDRWMTGMDGTRFSVQYKTDHQAFRTGNAFVETISVDTTGAPGWAVKCDADYLIYWLPEADLAYVLRPREIAAQLPRWRQLYREASAPNDGYLTIGLLVLLSEFEAIRPPLNFSDVPA